MNPPISTSKMPSAQKVASPIVNKKVSKKRDFGKKNNGTTTGFNVVAKKAAAEYGSKAAGEKVAGAVAAKIRAKSS